METWGTKGTRAGGSAMLVDRSGNTQPGRGQPPSYSAATATGVVGRDHVRLEFLPWFRSAPQATPRRLLLKAPDGEVLQLRILRAAAHHGEQLVVAGQVPDQVIPQPFLGRLEAGPRPHGLDVA